MRFNVAVVRKSASYWTESQLRLNSFQIQSTKSFSSLSEFEAFHRNYSTNTPLEKELHIYSAKKQTPVSLRSLMETGKGDKLQDFDELMKGKLSESNHHTTQKILIQVACFLHRELPVRLAHRAIKLESSPLLMRSGK